jgi:hypothetical protein
MGRHRSTAEVKEELSTCHGQVYLAAERLGCWPSALYARIKKSPELQQLLDLYNGRRTDAAELKLEAAIKNGEPWAIQFQLKTKGRNRGYVERQEVETHGNLKLELTERTGPELDRAIRRRLDALASGRETGAPAGTESLPTGFQAAD